MGKMQYHSRWLDVLDFAHKYRKDSYHHNGHSGNRCPEKGLWEEICARTAYKLGANPQSLQNLDDVFRLGDNLAGECWVCKGSLTQWRDVVQAQVENIPNFSSFT